MYQSIYYCHQEKYYYVRDDVKGWLKFQYYPTLYKEH